MLNNWDRNHRKDKKSKEILFIFKKNLWEERGMWWKKKPKC